MTPTCAALFIDEIARRADARAFRRDDEGTKVPLGIGADPTEASFDGASSPRGV